MASRLHAFLCCRIAVLGIVSAAALAGCATEPATVQFVVPETVEISDGGSRTEIELVRELIGNMLEELVTQSVFEGQPSLAVLPARGNLSPSHYRARCIQLEIEHSTAPARTFTLVERECLNNVLAELELQQSLLYDPATAAKLGRLVNAQYVLIPEFILVYGTLTCYARIVEVERGVRVAMASSEPLAIPPEPGEHPPDDFWQRVDRLIRPNLEARFDVSVWTPKTEYRIGDSLEVCFKPERDCHVYVIDVQTSGGLYLLFPNEYHPDSRVEGGQEQVIPAPTSPYAIDVGGPPGWEGIKVVATTKPINISVAPKGLAVEIRRTQREEFVRQLSAELTKLAPGEWAAGTWAFRILTQ